MAKGIKNKSYTEKFQELDLQTFRGKLEGSLAEVEDPRSQNNQTYSFSSLIGIIFCAVVSGANSITAIHDYAVSKEEWFCLWLDLPDKVPAYSVFWWLLVTLDPTQTEKLFRRWIDSLSPSDLKEIIALDGKRVRGASRRNTPESLLHMVSAWSSSRGLILGQVKTEEKSNEITAIPELIKSLDISGAILTIDAMGCQKEIASLIVEQGGNYVIGLKGNQPSLHDEVVNFFDQAQAVDFEGVQHAIHRTIDADHGRIEEREVYVSSEIDWLPLKDDWAGLGSVIMVISRRTIDGKTTEETRYYITNLGADAERLGKAIRIHWGIENSVHWVLDVTFEEDSSLITTGHAAENLSILKRLTLNMLRFDSDSKTSVKGKRRKAGWNNAYLARLLKQASIKSF